MVVGTLGKALGSYGAYVCVARDHGAAGQRGAAVPLPAPAALGRRIDALEILASEPERVERLRCNADAALRAPRRARPR